MQSTAPDYSWLVDEIRDELSSRVKVTTHSFAVPYGSTTATIEDVDVDHPDTYTSVIDFTDLPIPETLTVEIDGVELTLSLVAAVRVKPHEYKCRFAIE